MKKKTLLVVEQDKERQGQVLKQLMKENKVSYRQLGNALGISASNLHRLSHGEQDYTEDTLSAIAEFFNVTYEYLLCQTRNELIKKNYSIEEIENTLVNFEFRNSLQKKAFYLCSLMADKSLETIKTMMETLVIEQGLNFEEIKNKYLIITGDEYEE